jgi:CRISPR system Cascade subunit CasE
MTLYLSRITPARDAQGKLDLRILKADGYEFHKLVWSFFADGPNRKRDFLYRLEPNRSPRLFTVSAREPVAPSEAWTVEPKEYNPRIVAGDRLEFVLRANPIITRHDEAGKQKRRDVVMDAKHQLRETSPERTLWPSEARIAYDAGAKWLAKQAAGHGFNVEPDSLRVDGYRTHTFRKKPGVKPVRIATLDFAGCLAVTDSEMFRDLLFQGLGPAKGFGCGLMMVKRVS